MSGTFKAAFPFVVLAAVAIGVAAGGGKDIAGDIANPGRPDPALQSVTDFVQASKSMVYREQFSAGTAWRKIQFNFGRAFCHCDQYIP